MYSPGMKLCGLIDSYIHASVTGRRLDRNSGTLYGTIPLRVDTEVPETEDRWPELTVSLSGTQEMREVCPVLTYIPVRTVYNPLPSYCFGVFNLTTNLIHFHQNLLFAL
jgi:hypothetical protein